MLQPDPGKKKRYSGTYRKDKTGKTVEVTPPTNPINFGKYGKFFKQEGSTRSGARPLMQVGKQYNTQAFKDNILPQLQELNPDTDFYYEGKTYRCGGKMYAEGGELQDGELTEFNEGGTHEQHPEGGIPQGVAEDGGMNRVEEGETKVEDYIFSDKIKIGMDEIETFNLPSYVKGKSFADATKMINKKFEERKDNHSKSTQKKFMERSIAAQESKRKEMMQSGNSFGLGGLLSGASEMVGGVAGDQAAGAQGKRQSVGGATAKYALMGATAGSVVPGIGTAIGAGVGAIAGYTSATVANKKAEAKDQRDSESQTGKALISDGYNYRKGGGLSTPNIFKPETVGIDIGEPTHMSTVPLTYAVTRGFEDTGGGISSEGGGANNSDNPSFVNKAMAGVGALGSLAPVIGNIVAGASLKREEPNRFHTAGRTYQPEFVDNRGALNAVDEAYAGAKGAAADASGGDLGAYRASKRGIMANKASAKFNAYDYTNKLNMQEQRRVNEDYTQAANKATNAYNQEQIANKQDRAAYDAAKQVYRNATYEGLSSMGNMLLNNSIGDSSYDIFGNKILSDEEKAEQRAARKQERLNKRANKTRG